MTYYEQSSVPTLYILDKESVVIQPPPKKKKKKILQFLEASAYKQLLRFQNTLPVYPEILSLRVELLQT
jgi:hypothetical protein